MHASIVRYEAVSFVPRCLSAFRLGRDDPCVQHVGRLLTKKGRCIAFPNLYQHQVSPFTLLDKTKPGYRKILVLFLVDPTQTIPSATGIPPRQLEIQKYHLRTCGENSRLSQLPVELLDYIATLTPGVLDRTEAEVIRQQLMDERTVFIEDVNKGFFGQVNYFLLMFPLRPNPLAGVRHV